MTYITWPHIGLFTLAAPLVLWLIFVPLYWILGIGKTEGGIPGLLKVLGYVLFIIGAPIDLWVNLTWGTLLFLQPPSPDRGFLSARMDDLIVHGFGWRQALAIQIVGRFLEPFDKTGQHTTYGLYHG